MRHLRRVANLVHGLLLFFAALCAVVIVASLCQGVRDAAAYVTYALAIVACCAYAHAIRCLVPEYAGEPGGGDTSANNSAHRSPVGPSLVARVQNARRALLALFVVEALVSGTAVLAYLWIARGAPGTSVPGVGLALAPGFPDLSALAAIFGTVDTSSTSPRFLLDAPLGIFVLLLWTVERELGTGNAPNGEREPSQGDARDTEREPDLRDSRGAHSTHPVSAKTGSRGRRIES